jgi:hypothetical protein
MRDPGLSSPVYRGSETALSIARSRRAIARTASVMAARIMASAMTRRISSETESSLVVAGDICADEPVISFDDLFGSNEQVRGNLEAK